MGHDPTTQSNYFQIATDHVSLDWLVDFDASIIKGSATHDLIARVDNVQEVMSVSIVLALAVINSRGLVFTLVSIRKI